jgi:CBS domain-containing protein
MDHAERPPTPQSRISALPVLKDEKVVGIITETDMIRALIDLEEAQ